VGTKRRIKLYLVFAIIAATIILYPSSTPTNVPVYQGRPINDWYGDYVTVENPPEMRARAEQVLREMGTNWTPSFIERLSDFNDSKFKLKAMALLNKQSWIKFSFTTAEMRRESALNEFAMWGPGMSVAVPELVRLTKHTNPGIAAIAIRALGIANFSAATPIIEPILQAAASTNILVRQTAILSICQIYGNWVAQPGHTNRAGFPVEKVVHALLVGAKDSNLRIRVGSVDELGKLPLEPDAVVPALTGLLQDTNAAIRFGAARALGNYGTAARVAMPALKTALQDADKSVSGQAAMSLRRIEPETPPATNINLAPQTK
jgi:hypothetical protein